MNKQVLICLDSGHGGADPGAIANRIKEANIVFEVNNRLGKLLESNGVSVMYTRTAPEQRPSISERVRMANERGANYFFSTHVNAGGGTGSESFIFEGGDEARREVSRSFASVVLDRFCSDMGLRNRGVKPDTRTAVGSLGVLRNTHMPAQLFELAFIDGPKADVFVLKERCNEMAEVLAKGILTYLGVQNHATINSPISTPSDKPASKTVKSTGSINFDFFGRKAEVAGFIEDGTTWIQAMQALDAAKLNATWDSCRGMIVVKMPCDAVHRPNFVELPSIPSENTVTIEIFGRLMNIYGFSHNGITWVQARHLFESAGFEVSWDCVERVVIVEKRRDLAEEIVLLRELVYHEARGEDERGQRLIANVVLNRVSHLRRPNTIKDVIFESHVNSRGQTQYQFTPVASKGFGSAEHSDSIILAVDQALKGIDDSKGATHFHAISHLTQETWHEVAAGQGRLTTLFDHGNHRFYREE